MFQEVKDMIALAATADAAVELLKEGAPRLATLGEGFPPPDIHSEVGQALLHDVQWQLLHYAERCYWSASWKKYNPLPKVRKPPAEYTYSRNFAKRGTLTREKAYRREVF
jgi:hypothetical protein